MLISGFEAQVFLGIAVVLGCAFIALLCDYLKGINERLREQVLELAVRKEERESLERSLRAAMVATAHDRATQPAAAPAPSPQRPPAASPMPAASPVPSLTHRAAPPARPVVVQPPTPAPATVAPPAPVVETPPMITKPAEFAGALDTLISESANEPMVLPPQLELAATPPAPAIPDFQPILELPRLVEVMPAETPAEEQPDAEQSADQPNVVRIRVLRTPATPAESELEAAPEVEPAIEAPAAAAQPEPEAATPMASFVPEPVVAKTAATIPSKVEPLAPIATPSLPQLAVSVEAPAAVPVPPAALPPLALPAGFTDRATLDFLKRDPAPFTGLVVSIGINDYARMAETQGKTSAEELVKNVSQLVNSLIASPNGVQHFACRTADDEFVVIYPGETGSAAQRRLNSLSERLWDFQLRSLGTFSVVFSWGATEANTENFAEAVQAASERMLETRQNRKTISMGQPLKKVVNG